MQNTNTGRIEAPTLYVQDTGTIKGRGVYAGQAFAEGDVIERCPVLVLTVPFPELPADLQKLVFCWGTLNKQPIGPQAMALGFGSLYNHANPANAVYSAESGQLMLRFTAIKPITKDEEITINYNSLGGGATWHDDNWFNRMKVTPI